MRDFTVERMVRTVSGDTEMVRFHVRAVNAPAAIKFADEAKAGMEAKRGFDTMSDRRTGAPLFHKPHVPVR